MAVVGRAAAVAAESCIGRSGDVVRDGGRWLTWRVDSGLLRVGPIVGRATPVATEGCIEAVKQRRPRWRAAAGDDEPGVTR